MAATLAQIAAFFRFCTMASSITTVPQMVTVRHGVPQRMTSKKTGNGACATTRNKEKRFFSDRTFPEEEY